MTFSIIDVTESYQIEQLGTKSKFWFYKDIDAMLRSEKYLCKIGRPDTGENWSEKFASELGQLLGVPCVIYDLARSPEGEDAVICPSFVKQGGNLIHANELLSKVFESYPEEDAFGLREYKLNRSFALLKRLDAFTSPPVGFASTFGVVTDSVVEIFLSYLMFDCLIGNQDRHDENWGVVAYMNEDNSFSMNLAPTYDHASSLACRLTNTEREKRLGTKDHGYGVSTFATKARTPFYDSDGEKRFRTLECLKQAILISKSAKFADKCIDKVCSISKDNLIKIFNEFPDQYISDLEINFSIKIIEENQNRIAKLQGIE